MKHLDLTDDETSSLLECVRDARNSSDDAAKAYRAKFRLKPYEHDALRYHEREAKILTAVMVKLFQEIDGGA